MWQDLECWYRLLSGRKAICTGDITYCVDTDHSYDRITNVNKLYSTYHLFCVKQKITTKQQKYLKLHFAYYGVYFTSFLKFSFYRLIKSCDVRDFVSVIQYFQYLLKRKNR